MSMREPQPSPPEGNEVIPPQVPTSATRGPGGATFRIQPTSGVSMSGQVSSQVNDHNLVVEIDYLC